MVMNHEIIIFTPIFALLIGFIVLKKKRKRSAKSIYKLIKVQHLTVISVALYSL